MRWKDVSFLLMLLFACSSAVFSQSVNGNVTDESGEALIGATVMVKGTSNGTTTDFDGNFALADVSDDATLVISFTGYVSQEVAAGNNISVSLAEGQALEEVVITALKTENTLQKTSLAVTIVDGIEMRETAQTSADQVLRNIPNVVVQGAARGFVVAIRGLGSDLPPGVGESAVTTNFDGIYNFRAESGTLGFYDLNRVEVLRGPQGTLYGRNATGGVVNVISNDPSTEKVEGYATIDYGSFNQFRVEGAINLPIDKKVSARISMASINRDGFLSNGASDAVGSGVRGKLRYQPSDKLDMIIGMEFNHLGGKGPGFVPFVNFQNEETQLVTTASDEVSQDYNATKLWANINLEAGPGTLTILPSFQRGKGEVVGDMGMGPSTSFDPDPAEQTSLEVRYASKPESKIGWVAGVFYYGLSNSIRGIPSPDAVNMDETGSSAAFGQLTLPFGDKMRGLVGVRYGTDSKMFQGPAGPALEETWSAFDWKLGLESDLADNVLGYLTLASGHRPGGFNSFSPEGIIFQPESLVSAELGVKSQFNQRVQLNGALFYYDYNDFQVADFFFPPGSPFPVLDISNRGKVVNSGIEVESQFLLSRFTKLGLAFTYLNSEYKESFILHGPPPPPGVMGEAETVDMQGRRLPHAPASSINANLEHTFIMGETGRLTPSITYRWIGEQFVAPFPGEPQRQPAYSMIDASLRFSSRSGKWAINAYARNLTDEITKMAFFGADVIVGAPRQMGVSLTARF